MFGWIISFEIERDGSHVLLTVRDPSEDQDVVVRVTKAELAVISDAEPLAGYPGLVQTPTDFGRELPPEQS